MSKPAELESVLPLIFEHARAGGLDEVCGFLVRGGAGLQYRPCRNIAARGEAQPHPDDAAEAEDAGALLAYVHSHLDGGPAPSVPDRVGVERSMIPWLIVTPSGRWTWNEPCGYQAPLEGRQYLYGVCDCSTLVRDYFELEYSRVFEAPPAPFGWWKLPGHDHIREGLARQGFVQVDLGDVRRGDVLLFQLEALAPNHMAVVREDGRILHHMEGRLSKADYFGHFWRQRAHSAWRHPECK